MTRQRPTASNTELTVTIRWLSQPLPPRACTFMRVVANVVVELSDFRSTANDARASETNIPGIEPNAHTASASLRMRAYCTHHNVAWTKEVPYGTGVRQMRSKYHLSIQ